MNIWQRVEKETHFTLYGFILQAKTARQGIGCPEAVRYDLLELSSCLTIRFWIPFKCLAGHEFEDEFVKRIWRLARSTRHGRVKYVADARVVDKMMNRAGNSVQLERLDDSDRLKLIEANWNENLAWH